jgi:ParB family chromosome partitioning protein
MVRHLNKDRLVRRILSRGDWNMTETRRITDIIVAHCYRRDLGDIPGLAASIREFRLLRPVLITPDNRLIAGRRRLEACKLLGWETIPVNVVGE